MTKWSAPFATYSSIVVDAVNSATTKYDYLLPGGWKFILHVSSDTIGTDDFKITMQSSKGGGSFADVKMKTLEKYGPRYATGGDSLGYICRLLQTYGSFEDETIPEQIRKLERASDMTREQHEWLRDNLGYTNLEGAFAVPYQYAERKMNSYVEKTGSMRLAFSGANAEQDIMFCAIVLRELQNHLGSGGITTYWRYDLSELREIPNIRLWLDRLGINEVPELSS